MTIFIILIKIVLEYKRFEIDIEILYMYQVIETIRYSIYIDLERSIPTKINE